MTANECKSIQYQFQKKLRQYVWYMSLEMVVTLRKLEIFVIKKRYGLLKIHVNHWGKKKNKYSGTFGDIYNTVFAFHNITTVEGNDIMIVWYC